MSAALPDRQHQAPDQVLVDIADYVLGRRQFHGLAFETARLCLIDSLGCALESLQYPECTKLLGPLVPGTVVPHGARLPATPYQLDPVCAAFNLGAMIRWLDFNDTWLAAEWGHPSDNIGAILMTADWLSRRAAAAGGTPPAMRDVLNAMVQAYEIHGVIALENSFHDAGLDHVLLVKVASTAVVARLLGLDRDQIINAISLAWVDGHALRTYRHAPNTGSRKGWAAADAASRAVRLALMARSGEMGCPSALSAPTWGFQDACFGGRPLRISRPYGSYVIENILFKVRFPAEFHGQTAVEAALALREQLAATGRSAADIERITLRTQQAAIRIIDNKGPLRTPPERDHCIQYMVAVALLHGRLTAPDYEDAVATDPRIDALRQRIDCVEDPRFTADYHDPDKRSIANALGALLRDGTQWPEVVVEYPIGHRLRRAEATPLLDAKFRANLARSFAPRQQQAILHASMDSARMAQMPVHEYVDLYCPQ
jgi:2-methylcitrate dehydratase